MNKNDLFVEFLISKFKENNRNIFDKVNVIKRLKYYSETKELKFSMNDLSNDDKTYIYVNYLKRVKEILQKWIEEIDERLKKEVI